MTSRSRYQAQDWDLEDETSAMYDAQYHDDDNNSGLVTLDHCRLYITNIPKALNEEGLRTAFARYGNLVEAYLSQDPHKKYALVTYETTGEAKLAMTKLNRTEPLRLNISIAHQAKAKKGHEGYERREHGHRGGGGGGGGGGGNTSRDRRSREDNMSASSRERHRNTNKRQEDLSNGDNMMEDFQEDVSFSGQYAEPSLEVDLKLEELKLEHLKLQQASNACMQRIMVLKNRKPAPSGGSINRCLLPDGRTITRHVAEKPSLESRDVEGSYGAGAGDTNTNCPRKNSWDQRSEGTSTPSTCVVCSEGETRYRQNNKTQYSQKSYTASVKNIDSKTTNVTIDSTTDVTRKTSYTASKKSDVTSKKFAVGRYVRNKSDMTCDLKYSDFYSDSDEEADETNRLIQLRTTDYVDIVDDSLKIVVALSGYPKSKMRLKQMELFNRCLADVMDMQLKAGLLKKMPSFLDYYLNRGAIVCVCRDMETRDWMVRVSPGLQERMTNNLIFLKAKVKRLCLAVFKIPQLCWPASAQDAFKLLQYFNPTLKTDQWKIYSQKTIDGVECTSFLIDRVSGEIIRGPNFKNVIDYDHMDFELTGYTEIYYECLMTNADEDDLCSVASRVKLLEELKSAETTPRNASEVSLIKREEKIETLEITRSEIKECFEEAVNSPQKSRAASPQKEILDKIMDVKYYTDKDEVIVWSEETEKVDVLENAPEESIPGDHVTCTSIVAMSDKTESVAESTDNLNLSKHSNLTIDSNRGIAYHRRTNYLHIENELKVAITLEGYPQNKLEGTHIRRLKQLFKEYLHKDMKMQRFGNLIIPKFHDVYLSNGAVIYICDSLETKDYLTELLPKFVNSTGLKLAFRDMSNLVRYTRVVMRLPKEYANVETIEVLLKLQVNYPNLKPDCWKFYSDVAGKQKRQFGVDPESLEVIKHPDFDPTYEGEKLSFRIIDRQKRDVSFEGSTANESETNADENKKAKDKILKMMYVPIETDAAKSPLTKIRTEHYADLIDDDFKLYVGPSNYPETRVDEVLFHSIKRALENLVCEMYETGEINEQTVPKLHDLYLFDGVIFIICQGMTTRDWVENALFTVNVRLQIQLKATEFRGAVGIISMVVKTEKDTDYIIKSLQEQNTRLRTKFWRKISVVRSKNKLDVVLQIDKLSAQVIISKSFNKYVDGSQVVFKLGHLQSLIKAKPCEEVQEELKPTVVKSKVSMQGPKDKEFDELKLDLKKEYPSLKIEDWGVISQHEKSSHKVCELEIDTHSAKIIETEDYKLSTGNDKVYFYTEPCNAMPVSPLSISAEPVLPEIESKTKIIVKIPSNVLPESRDDLNIIFDLLEDKNPGLNTELWQVMDDPEGSSKGKYVILVDKQSASIIQNDDFKTDIAGSKLKFFF